MPIRNLPRRAGQRKLARYVHTKSCARLSGAIPPPLREAQLRRRRWLPVIVFLLYLAGLLSLCL